MSVFAKLVLEGVLARNRFSMVCVRIVLFRSVSQTRSARGRGREKERGRGREEGRGGLNTISNPSGERGRNRERKGVRMGEGKTKRERGLLLMILQVSGRCSRCGRGGVVLQALEGVGRCFEHWVREWGLGAITRNKG